MILLVDDTPTNIDILISILGDDYDISVALCGEDALEIMEEELPDLVFLDVLMPGISGYEVLEHMKGQDSLKTIPVVFLSGNSEETERQKGLSLGAEEYLVKPIDAGAVMAQAKKYC
ncbi:MAG: response regulator [Spirochaetales bacterium]|nr:response regulator [Spirochaetales bacterium]